MTWSMIRPLPGHPAVLASFDWQAQCDGVRVEYTGPSLDELHAAGCIPDEVLGAFARAGLRVLRMADGSSCRRSRWYGEYRRSVPFWKIEWRTRRQYALTLPGVAEPSAEQPSMVQRSRCVGRRQRPATWMCIENLIVVDWDAIRVRSAEAVAS